MDLRKLDYEYKYPGTQVVFTSPLKRCTETAKFFIPNKIRLLSTTFPNVISVNGRSKTADELKNDPDFEKWLAGDSSVKPPRGRAMPILHAEYAKCLKALLRDL